VVVVTAETTGEATVGGAEAACVEKDTGEEGSCKPFSVFTPTSRT
jgi:hypothetical protein